MALGLMSPLNRSSNTDQLTTPVTHRFGCTSPRAENFNAVATHDDSSCIIMGCTEQGRPGYDPLATDSDNSCGPVVSGCRDSSSENFFSAATTGGDELCVWRGCTHSLAINYDPSATADVSHSRRRMCVAPPCIGSLYTHTGRSCTSFFLLAGCDLQNPAGRVQPFHRI